MNKWKLIANGIHLKILLLNNAITVKNSVEIFNSTLDQHRKKESVNSEAVRAGKRKRKKKWMKEGEKAYVNCGYL